jgi:hypothetical protein
MEDQRAAAEPLQHGTAAGRFAEQLRTLRTSVGNPSFRKMAGRSGRISHTTLHEAAAGTRFPSWETTREFVRACDAEEAQWRRRWEDAQRTGAVHAVPNGDLTPVVTDSVARIASPGIVDTTTTDVVASEMFHAGAADIATSDLVPAASRALREAEHVQLAAGAEATGARRLWWRWLTAAAVVAMVAVLGVTVRSRSQDDSGAMAALPTGSSAPGSGAGTGSSDALIPGDASRFVSDVTIPDGTRVKVNAHFVKVWALANVGAVGWHNRFLATTHPTGDDDGCRVPNRVSIGDTLPGEQVMISVPVTAPSRPGQCWVSWKMVDEHGQAYFPSRRPVYFLVNVTT